MSLLADLLAVDDQHKRDVRLRVTREKPAKRVSRCVGHGVRVRSDSGHDLQLAATLLAESRDG